jgi:hypothetical protein
VVLTNFSSISHWSNTTTWSAYIKSFTRASSPPLFAHPIGIGRLGTKELTQNLLQLHDTGVCTNAMDRGRLLDIWAFLEDLAVGAIGAMGVVLLGHDCDLLREAGGGAREAVMKEGQALEIDRLRCGKLCDQARLINERTEGFGEERRGEERGGV